MTTAIGLHAHEVVAPLGRIRVATDSRPKNATFRPTRCTLFAGGRPLVRTQTGVSGTSPRSLAQGLSG